MEKIEKDFEELLRLFNKHGVRYCIIGAFAVAFHAIPRYTKDIDIFLDSDLNNSKRVVNALNEFGFENLGLTSKDFTKKGEIIQLGFEPVRIDLLTSLEGIKFTSAWKNKETGKYGNTKVNFLGLNDLIRVKRKAGRAQDIADLEKLYLAKKLKLK